MKLPGANFDLAIWRKEKAITLTITGLDGESVLVPITVDVAEELGLELLAAKLALTGSLNALDVDEMFNRAKVS
ncbi:hypothetical protein BVC93_20250 [Mycobacterium sp. MS1601]|uniref:hypothetical protein n=1 Tax=Mycobacterium sp. MS1601 TaxID=1936029 RepID=UPI0009794C56|nr:hypothetical protein [Mycobacterium sp. MS1601]AQA04369.1 hypothetical protein BVC93_20250 [Mycobacterium sp. MS1601]